MLAHLDFGSVILRVLKKDIGGRLCSGQPATALKTETKDKVDVPIWDDCHIMTSELCTAVGI
jgi:hypothetical protein